MKIRLDDFDSLEIELANGRPLHLSTSRNGDLTRVRIDADATRPPIILHYLTGRDADDELDETARRAAGKARVLAILKRTIAELEAGRHV